MKKEEAKMDHSKIKHGGHNHQAMIADFKKRFYIVQNLTCGLRKGEYS